MEKKKRKLKPASTPEGRMHQLTEKAFDLAYRQLEKGNIAPSTLNVLLKAGTAQAQLELENKRAQNKLFKSKAEMIDNAVKESGDTSEAIAALKGYRSAVYKREEDDEVY